MDTILQTQLWLCPEGKPAPSLTVVAAYEDTATEARVQRFCRSLQMRLGQGCPLTQQMWPASELRLEPLRRIAAEEAAHADLIIVSVHFGEQLPAELQAWTGLWRPRRHSGRAALLALFDPLEQGSSCELQSQLKNLAQRAQRAFLVQIEDGAEETPP